MPALVYPPLNHETDSETIFFIGNAENFCVINGNDVELLYDGNFCPVFELKIGENIFDVEIDGVRSEIFVERFEEIDNRKDHDFRKYSGKKISKTIRKICIDPGHGGIAWGTCSPKGFSEKALNLSLSLELKKQLEELDFGVVLTRDRDIDLSLEDRVRISKENNCDLFLSIHHNAIADHLNPIEHYGISAHYYYDHSKELALNLSSKLAEALVMKNNSAIRQNLYVTRENLHSKAILLECGYLIHPEESEQIIKPEFQTKLAVYLSKLLKNS